MVFGASLAALELLASHHDYKLIYTNKNSINAFFIRNDLLPDGVVEALPLSKTSTSVWDHIIRRSIMVLRVKHHTVDLSFQQPFNFVITTTVPRGVC